MGTPTVPFDPTGNPFPKHPPSSGERDEEPKENEEQTPDDGSKDLS